jgi:hypothetical protein
MANSAQYHSISPEVYNQLKQQLSGLGITLEGNSGKVSKQGVSAEYNYDPNSGKLDISNVKVGFPASMMFSEDKIIAQINEAVQRSGGQVQA